MNNAQQPSLFLPKEAGERYTHHAIDLERAVIRAVAPTMSVLVDAGFPIREVEYVVTKAVEMWAMERLLTDGLAKIKRSAGESAGETGTVRTAE